MNIEVDGLENLQKKLDNLITDEMITKGLHKTGLRIEADAKRNCPVDTGNLRASLTTVVADNGKSVEIGTNVVYAPYVELGTRKQQAQPYLTPAYNENIKNIAKDIKSFMNT